MKYIWNHDSKHRMRKSISPWQWLLFVVFMIFWVWFVNRPPIQKPNPRAPVIMSHNSSMTPLWVRTNYYMYPSDHIQMVALGNKLFSIGSASDKEEPQLIALDARTGDIIWQYGDANVSVLTTSENKLFVGELGGGRIIALNPDTGAIEWSIKHIGNVTNMLVRENILYVDTVSENYFLFDVNIGNLLKTIPYTVDGAPNDEIPIWSDKKKRLQFVGNIMYFQFPTDFPVYKGEITATDEVSGNEIWSSGPLYAITRIATSPLGVFVLNSDGNLLKFRPNDGAKEQTVQFAPAPTLRNGYAFGYYVAVDSDNQLLFVYLGDSTQLFAFHIQ